jgi:hypothetical protein
LIAIGLYGNDPVNDRLHPGFFIDVVSSDIEKSIRDEPMQQAQSEAREDRSTDHKGP